MRCEHLKKFCPISLDRMNLMKTFARIILVHPDKIQNAVNLLYYYLRPHLTYTLITMKGSFIRRCGIHTVCMNHGQIYMYYDLGYNKNNLYVVEH